MLAYGITLLLVVAGATRVRLPAVTVSRPISCKTPSASSAAETTDESPATSWG